METLAAILIWLAWVLVKALSLAWVVLWFLVGGWVSALAQIAVVVAAVYVYRYGWRVAPVEIARQASAFGRFAWAWMRTGTTFAAAAAAPGTREVIREVRVRQPGDVNLSSLLSVAMLLGLCLLATLSRP